MSKSKFPSHLFDEKGKILFDHLPIPSFAWQVVNGDLILINYNYAAHEITKGTIEKFVGIEASELYKDQPEIIEDLKQCAKEKSNFFKELKYKFKLVDDKKYFSFNYGFIPPDIVVVHTNDITEKRHAELKRKEIEVKLKESEKNLNTLNQKLEQKVEKRTKKLKESEERHRLILENLNDLVYIVNLKLEIEYVNEEVYKQLLGYSISDTYGTPLLDIIHPDDYDNAIKALKKFFKKGYGIVELRVRNKKGGYNFFEIKGRLFIDYDGKQKGLIVACNINHRKEAEQQLKESEEGYRLITENSNDLIRVVDGKFKTEYINEQTHQRLLGYKIEDLIGTSFNNLVHPDEADQLNKLIREVVKIGEGRREGRLKHKDGHWIWFDMKTKLFKDSKGNFKGLSVSSDITEKKRAEQRLIESEQKYRLISENVNDIITVQGGNFNIEYINEHALKKILGYSKGELLGKKAITFVHPDDKERILKEFMRLFNEREASVEGRLIQKSGGLIWAEFNGKLVYDEKQKPKFLLVTRDITERKEAEDKLKKSEEKYREAYDRANFYKDLFVHDINNIMQVVNSSAELISYQIEAVEKTKDIGLITDMIKNQVLRAKKLVKSVNILSELEDSKKPNQSIELCGMLKKSINYLKTTYQVKNIDIKFESFRKRIFLEANELLQDVFDNILINAVKHNDKNSVEIFIKIYKEQIGDNNFIKLEFTDNGMGVEDDRKDIIFKRGYSEYKDKKGMGIGLSLVKKIVNNYNGKIWVEDKVNGDHSQGSKFVVLIPNLINFII